MNKTISTIVAMCALTIVGCQDKKTEPTDTGSQTADTGSDVEPVCEGHVLTPDFGMTLTEHTSCSDVALFAYNEEKTIMVSAIIPNMLTEAITNQDTLIKSFSFPSDDVSVKIELGKFVDGEACNDAIAEAPIIDVTLTPISGKITVTVVPQESDGSGEQYGWATATISTDAVFQDESGECVGDLGGYAWSGVGVGWLPGR